MKTATEDRTIAHFDITSVTTFATATLKLSTQDQDFSFPGTSNLDVYSFAGDGTVSVDEFGLGTLIHEETGLTDEAPSFDVDITALLMSAVSNGDTYLSFNLRNEPGDRGRFILSHVIDGIYGSGTSAGPTTIQLTGTPVVPLPAGGVLLLSGLGAVLLTRKRRR